MLSKNVFFEEMEKLIVFYPSWNINFQDLKVSKAWYNMMITQNVSDESLTKAVIKHIKEIKFNPTIASLIECGMKKYNCSENKNDDVPVWVWEDQ